MSLVDDFKELANDFVTDTFKDFTQTFVIESLTKIPDDQGGFTTVWATFTTPTGFVKSLSAKEIIKDDRIKSDQAKEFSFEYISGIKSDMRIVYEGVNYNILPFEDIMDANIWLKIVGDKDSAT